MVLSHLLVQEVLEGRLRPCHLWVLGTLASQCRECPGGLAIQAVLALLCRLEILAGRESHPGLVSQLQASQGVLEPLEPPQGPVAQVLLEDLAFPKVPGAQENLSLLVCQLLGVQQGQEGRASLEDP